MNLVEVCVAVTMAATSVAFAAGVIALCFIAWRERPTSPSRDGVVYDLRWGRERKLERVA